MLALRKVSVHAYEDPGRPEGGHAVLLLHSVDKVPANTSIRLKPADPGTSADAAGWPQGELTPLACRTTPEGLELQIGPDITESELLLPGTLVEVELPGSSVRGEFLWPNIAPVLRPKKRTVIVNTPRRGQDASKQAASESGKGTAQHATQQTSPAAASDGGRQPVADAAQPAAAGGTEAALDAIESIAAAKPATASDALAALDAIESIAAGATQQQAAAAPAAEAAKASGDPAPAKSQATTAAVAPVPALRGARPTAARGEPAAAAAPAAKPPLAPRSDDQAFYPHARAGRAAPSPKVAAAAEPGGSRRASNALQAITGLIAVVAALYVLSRESSMRTVAPQPAADGASIVLPSSTTQPPPSIYSDRSASAATLSLFETLAAGAVSPRGASAAATTPTRALENANSQLSGVNRDTEEAGFWLRRYITGALGNDRTTRALTQLGSVYAEPVGGAQPDYVKARLLWELAGAAGDPVAMCFLGLLSENGLGVPVDRQAALQWYERSKQAGGCPQVDASIARVKQ